MLLHIVWTFWNISQTNMASSKENPLWDRALQVVSNVHDMFSHHQEALVSQDSLASPGYQEQRVTQDSQGSASQDPLGLKVRAQICPMF